MGCCVSLRSSSSSAAAATNIKNVRVVHLNGCVEEFDYPVSVSQVTGRPPKHFIFTASQLLSAGLQPLKPDTLLERGNVYFLLPSTSFDYADVSPLTLAATVKKLTEKAKSGNSVAMPSPPRNSPARSPSRTVNDVESLPQKRSWRPILHTIREISFNRSSVSDISDVCLQDH